uniref:Gastric inhibitory polypeptide receptor n=1 Tax=Corvus moneduloides TaxID=1196302 RepID=A0A8U7N2W8_CORMO
GCWDTPGWHWDPAGDTEAPPAPPPRAPRPSRGRSQPVPVSPEGDRATRGAGTGGRRVGDTPGPPRATWIPPGPPRSHHGAVGSDPRPAELWPAWSRGALRPGHRCRVAPVPPGLRAAPAPGPARPGTRLQPQLRPLRVLGGRCPQQHRHCPLPLVPALVPPSAGRGGGAALRPRRALGDRRQREALAGQFPVRGPGAGAAAAAPGVAAGAVPPPLHRGIFPVPCRAGGGAAAAAAAQAPALHPEPDPRQPLCVLRAPGRRYPHAGRAAAPRPRPRPPPAAAGHAGVPVVFVVPWVVLRYLYENEGCWERNEKVAVWWVIRCPILVAVAVNFVVFMRIVRILVAKVRAHQVSRGDTRLRLARSTLTLIPLLGVHEVVFALAGEGEGGGGLRLARLCLHLLLTSAQGLVVSILYCFTNKEVQAEVRRGWQRCRLGVPGPPRGPRRGHSRQGQHPVAESGC